MERNYLALAFCHNKVVLEEVTGGGVGACEGLRGQGGGGKDGGGGD